MSLLQRLKERRCRKRGHDWFPGGDAREFIPMTHLCFRCGAKHHTLPYGRCLNNHAISQHYEIRGSDIIVRPVGKCRSPQ